MARGNAGTLKANASALTLALPQGTGPGTVDVVFDDRRVWSVTLPEENSRGTVRLEWPKAMQSYLRGGSFVEVRDSATGSVLAAGEVRIGRSSRRIRFIDPQGRHLAMTKWDRLGPTFEGESTGMQDRLLASGRRLVGDLVDLGYDPFVVGGTLLGAMRNGELMAHDDDMDLAWVCDADNALDIALASMQMERELVDRGYTCIRLGYAHIQVTFFASDARTDHYVDIFTGFYSEGLYCQPFALRGELSRESLVPTSTITINDLTFPAPAVPEDWLRFAYGENWRIPDPSFKFDTSRWTARRFENWFGVFNRGRVYWEKAWEAVDEWMPSQPDRAFATLLELLPPGAAVVDLGTGQGTTARLLADAGHPVIAADYSYEALRVAKAVEGPDLELRYLNLNDRRELLRFAVELVRAGIPRYVTVTHVLEGVASANRQTVFLFLRYVLELGGFAFATFDTKLDFSIYRKEKPDTWHLPPDWLIQEAASQGLSVEVIGKGSRRTQYGRRPTATVLLRRDELARDVEAGLVEVAAHTRILDTYTRDRRQEPRR